MARSNLKTKDYRNHIRELRKLDPKKYNAKNGYRLSGKLSSGIKAAITRAYNKVQRQKKKSHTTEPQDQAEHLFEEGEEIYQYRHEYNESYGDDFEEWNDIDFIDWDYDFEDDIGDEEQDHYPEGIQ